MNLIIDIGNSRAKCAIFSGKEMIESFFFPSISVDQLKEMKDRFPGTDKAILSAVSSVDAKIEYYLRSAFSYFLKIDHHTPVPILNNYKTPETLGLDRLAAAVGANTLFPGQDLLVIDAGTAITFDMVEKNGTFAGGNISPGLKSRFRALHEFTSQLPLVDASEEWPQLGRSTEDAIRAGVTNGMILEIEGMIEQLTKSRPGLQAILTGGDAHFFERRLKSPIFVKSEITLIGLNRILEYNVEKQ